MSLTPPIGAFPYTPAGRGTVPESHRPATGASSQTPSTPPRISHFTNSHGPPATERRKSAAGTRGYCPSHPPAVVPSLPSAREPCPRPPRTGVPMGTPVQWPGRGNPTTDAAPAGVQARGYRVHFARFGVTRSGGTEGRKPRRGVTMGPNEYTPAVGRGVVCRRDWGVARREVPLGFAARGFTQRLAAHRRRVRLVGDEATFSSSRGWSSSNWSSTCSPTESSRCPS